MPLQKSSGVAIFVSLQECGFSRAKPYTGKPTLHSHATKLGLRSTSSNANRLVCKNAVALGYYGSFGLVVMGSWEWHLE